MSLPQELVRVLQLLRSLHIIPAFSFRRSLFLKLIREGIAKNKIDPEDEGPQVVFTEGPIDGVLGFYNGIKKRITIDVLEIYILCLTKHLERGGEGNLQEHFDLEVTRVLAHEGGHWHLEKRHGIWPDLEILFLRILMYTIGIVAGLVMLYGTSIFLAETVTPFLVGGSKVMLVICLVLLAIFISLLGAEIFCRYWIFVSMVSHLVTYKICYHERFAREFEQRPNNDPRWTEVIEVEDD